VAATADCPASVRLHMMEIREPLDAVTVVFDST
jgi:hypothetical protein